MISNLISLGTDNILCWVECSVDVCQVKLRYSVLCIFYILIYFMPTCYSNIKRKIVKSLTIIVGLYFSSCSSTSFCFNYFEALALGTWTFKIWVISRGRVNTVPVLHLSQRQKSKQVVLIKANPRCILKQLCDCGHISKLGFSFLSYISSETPDFGSDDTFS